MLFRRRTRDRRSLIRSCVWDSDLPPRRKPWFLLTSDFATEFLFQLSKRNLDHGRPSMRAAVRQIAVEQIADQLFHFRIAQRIVGFDSVPAHTLGDHLFSQTHR